MLYVTTRFLATEIIIFVDTETHSSCIVLQGQAILHSYEKSIYSSPTSVAPLLTVPLPFSELVYQNAFLAILLPFGYTYHIMFNLKATIYRNPFQFTNILKISLFSKSSLSLHATEQLVQQTMKLFLSLQGGGI